MKVLEITPLKEQALTVFIVEKEYNESFWLIEPPSDFKPLRPLFKPSVAFCTVLEKLVEEISPDFATEELGMRSVRTFYEENILAGLFRANQVPFFPVDIDEYAKAYLETSVQEKKRELDKVLNGLAKYQKDTEPDMDQEYLIAYGQCLQRELQDEEREISFPVREKWVVMEIMSNARNVSDRNEVTCVHICSPEHVEGVMSLLKSLDVSVEVVNVSKRVVSMGTERSGSEELTDLLQSMHIKVKPTIRKASEDAPYLLFFLDTDKRASPFDICMAYDAGFNAVIPYDNIIPEDAKSIVQDAIFSRTKKGIKHTCFFIGGRNEEKATQVMEAVRGTMFPPFEAAVILDPGGAHTTAAAMIAKVEDAIHSHSLGELKNKNCAVFGTGAVGRLVAVLLARLGCGVVIASLNPNRVDGEEYAESVSRSLLERYGVTVKGVFAPTPEKKGEVLRQADVIFCTGARGVRIIEKEMLEGLKFIKVMADLNAIPPFGIEGVKPNDDMREMSPGIFTIAALTIGKLKHELEKEILREARRNGKGTYDYTFALQRARKLIKKKVAPADLTVTLQYQPEGKRK